MGENCGCGTCEEEKAPEGVPQEGASPSEEGKEKQEKDEEEKEDKAKEE